MIELNMVEILEWIKDHIVLLSFAIPTFVQISPIKINPWSKLLLWIRKILLGDIDQKTKEIISRLDSIEDSLSAEKNERIQDGLSSVRWMILDFQNSCLQNRRHTKEEWDHCIDELKIYENKCRDYGIPNGVMDEAAKYLRATYQKRLDKQDFLEMKEG